MTTDSQKQEKRGAKVYGGTVNAGSGNTTGHKNDVRTDDLSIEFKTTKAKSHTLRLDTLRNAEKEALLDGRDAILGLDFQTGAHTFRYVILPEWDYLSLRDHLKELEERCDDYRHDAAYWESSYYSAQSAYEDGTYLHGA